MPLTRQIAGDPRPKQFCPIFDGETTLLDRTRHRAELLTRLDHQVIVVTHAHEPYSVRRIGWRPAWLGRVELASAG